MSLCHGETGREEAGALVWEEQALSHCAALGLRHAICHLRVLTLPSPVAPGCRARLGLSLCTEVWERQLLRPQVGSLASGKTLRVFTSSPHQYLELVVES